MTPPIPYRAEDRIVILPVADYVARFRDAERFAACCRTCPNYGHSWGCPPFAEDPAETFAGYRTALLVATKITPETSDLPMQEAGRLIRPERIRLERRLLELERRTGGRAFSYVSYVGSCLYCPEGSCTRPEGLPCRHPDKVRPSLEACGFDIGRTTEELFGIRLLWGTEGRLPAYLTLVCTLFHNGRTPVWEP